MQLSKQEPEKDAVPTYGLLPINHAYNEGKLTFQEWLELSREWALKMIEQYGDAAACPSPSCYNTNRIDKSTGAA
jgi:hypothetical protein